MDTTANISDDLRRYMGMLWRWAWLLALSTVLGAGAAYLVSIRMTPVYQASTTVLINEAPATRSTDYASLVLSERLAQTYAELMVKAPVLEEVINRLQLPYAVTSLKKVVQVQPVRDTTLIEVRVEDADPHRAAEIANTLVAVFAEQNRALQAARYDASKQSLREQMAQIEAQIREADTALAALGDVEDVQRDRLEANIAQYRQTYASLLQSYEQIRVAEAQTTASVVQAELASAPGQPIRPRTRNNTALAGVVGLMIAAGIVFLIETLDDTLRTAEQVARELGLPVLGIIATHTVPEGQPISAAKPRSLASEDFRSLRTNIQYASVDRSIRSLLVTSPSPSEGKSTVASNLAIVLAQSGSKVALIDADLRKPNVHKVLGLPNRLGLSNLFVQTSPLLNGHMQPTVTPNLAALTSGALPPNPSELLGSEKMFRILGHIHESVDMIIVDSPPVLAVTDSAVLGPRVDGVILVLKPGATKLAAARHAVDQLRRVGARILGVVLNEVETGRRGYSYNYYYTDPESFDFAEEKPAGSFRQKMRLRRQNTDEAARQ